MTKKHMHDIGTWSVEGTMAVGRAERSQPIRLVRCSMGQVASDVGSWCAS